jgi:hypothetical protein
MHVRTFPIEFIGQLPLIEPKDEKLWALVQDFAKSELAEMPDFSGFQRAWAACEIDKDGKPVKVVGLTALATRVDIPLMRFTNQRAFLSLFERLQGFCADSGLRGQEVFVYISSQEPDTARCPGWEKALEFVGAKPAERYRVECK